MSTLRWVISGPAIVWTVFGLVPCGSPLAGCVSSASSDDDAGPVTSDDGALDSGVQDASADVFSLRDSAVPCSADGFCRTVLPGAPSPTITGFYSASPTRAVAATSAGSLLLWNGTAWSTLAFGYGTLSGIWAHDPDHFWIAESLSTGNYTDDGLPIFAPSVLRLTFDQETASIVSEALPSSADCAQQFAISGTSDTDIYLTTHCWGYSFDTDGNFHTDSTGLLYHRGAEGETAWTLLWTAGDPSSAKVVLGGVYAVTPSEAWVVGWKSAAFGSNDDVSTFISPGFNRPSDPGTSTMVVHIKDGSIEEEDLDPSLALCAQSVWTSGASGSLFVGGACQFAHLTPQDRIARSRIFVTGVRKTIGQDGGSGWVSLVQAPYSTVEIGAGVIPDYPSTFWGFSDADVYVAGSYAQHWDGTNLRFVELAIDGAPFDTETVAIQGSSKNDLWIVGATTALHRTQ